MRPVRYVVVLASFAATLLASSPSGFACTCGTSNLRNALDAAPAAFIGRVESTSSAGGARVLRYRVDQVLKGDLGETVEVFDRFGFSTCALSTTAEPNGLILGRDGSRWVAGACSSFAPDALAAAVSSLPEPDGRGPPAVLVASPFGPVRAMTFDARGRLLRYGFGGPRISTMSLCPGERRLLLYGESRVAVRDPDTLRLERVERLREIESNPIESRSASPVLCRDAAGRSLAVFQTNRHQPVPTSHVVVYEGARLVHRVRGSWMDVAFSPDRKHAWLAGGRYGHEISRLDLDTGKLVKVMQIPEDPRIVERRRTSPGTNEVVGPPSISPDGRRLAMRSYVGPGSLSGPARLILLDVTASPPRMTSTPVGGIGGDPRWIDSLTFLSVPAAGGSLDRYDTSLRRLGTLAGWPGSVETIRDGIVWGIGNGVVLAAKLPDGEVHALELPERYVSYAHPGVTGQVVAFSAAGLPPQKAADLLGAPAADASPTEDGSFSESPSPEAAPSPAGLARAAPVLPAVLLMGAVLLGAATLWLRSRLR